MADKVCGDAYNELLNDFLKGATPPGLYFRLYSNNHTPVLNETPGNFTELTTVNGYAGTILGAGAWTITDTAGVLVATYPQQTYTFTGAFTVYGYYITDSGKTKVYWAGLAAGGPFVYGAGGGLLLWSLELDGPLS